MINKTNFLYMSFIQYCKLLAYLKKKQTKKQTNKQIKNKNNKNKTTPD
jgi:hypothetical protein